MQRTISGELLNKDVPLSPTSTSLEDSLVSRQSSALSITVKETKLDDGELKEVEDELDEKKERRRKLKSVLKSTKPTPVITEEGLVVNNTIDSTRSDSFRVRSPHSPAGRECCIIL